jgi:hypothetical protein
MMIKNLWNGIKMAWGAKKILAEATKETKTMEGEVKSGWRTTEFWGAKLTQIATLIAMALSFKYNVGPEFQEQIVTLGMSVIAAVETGYSISRGIAKKK